MGGGEDFKQGKYAQELFVPGKLLCHAAVPELRTVPLRMALCHRSDAGPPEPFRDATTYCQSDETNRNITLPPETKS
jgi:hypothetical protein